MKWIEQNLQSGVVIAVALLIGMACCGKLHADQSHTVLDTRTVSLSNGTIFRDARIVRINNDSLWILKDNLRDVISVSYRAMVPSDREYFSKIGPEKERQRIRENIASSQLEEAAITHSLKVIQVVDDGVYLDGISRYFIHCDPSSWSDGNIMQGPFWVVGTRRYQTASNSYATCKVVTRNRFEALKKFIADQE